MAPLMFDRVRLDGKPAAPTASSAPPPRFLDLAKHGADTQREMMTTVRAMLQVMARAYVRDAGARRHLQFLSLQPDRQPAVDPRMSIVGPNGRVQCSPWPLVASRSSRRDRIRDARTRDFVSAII